MGFIIGRSVWRIGSAALALWACALCAAPAQENRMAQLAPGARAQTPPAPSQQTAAAAQIPIRTEIMRFDGWTVTCNEFAEGARAKRCSALLQIMQQNTSQVVFTWTVGLDEKKQLMAVIQTPSGVVIPPGVELRIGKLPAQKIPFTACDPGRCVATAAVDANLLKEMTTSQTAEAVIQATEGNTVQFNIQMKGFDRAYAALK